MHVNDARKIIAELPFPIASAYKKYKSIIKDRWFERVAALVSVAESIVKFLAAISSKSLLVDGAPDENFRRELGNFTKSSLGHWVSLLRTSLKPYANLPKSELIEALSRWYDERLGSETEIKQAIEKLCLVSDIQPPQGKIKNSSILSLLGQYRNKMAHGSRLSDEEYRIRHEAMETLINRVLAGLAFLSQFSLCFVEEAKTSKDHYELTLRVGRGTDFDLKTVQSPVPIQEARLYLILFSESDAPLFALDLSPYAIFKYCPSCRDAQVFFYNSVSGRSLEYLSYGCGHHISLEDPTGDFAGIDQFLAGKIPLDALLKSKVIGREIGLGKIGPSRENRKKAARLSNLGREMLLQGLTTEALRLLAEAESLDIDSGTIKINLGLAMLADNQQPASVVQYASQACRLSPDSARIHYLCGRIFQFYGMHKSAEESLRKAASLDPSNQLFRSAVNLLPDVVAAGSKNPPETVAPEMVDKSLKLVHSLLSESTDDLAEIRMWITALPPWRWLRRKPFLYSSFFTAALLLVVFIFNYKIINPINSLRFVTIGMLVLWSVYLPFVVPKLLINLYHQLKAAVTLPTQTLSRWFLAEVVSLGIYTNEEQSSVRKNLKKDPFILTQFFLWMAASVVFYSIIVYGIDPPGGFYWQQTGWVPGIIRYCLYFLEIYFLLWVPPFVIRAILIIPRFIRLPVRYFISMPDAVSIKPLGNFYLKLGALGAISFFFFAFQHYVAKTYLTTPLSSIGFILMNSMLFFVIVFVSQINILLLMAKLRKRKLVQFSFTLEEAFQTYMQECRGDKFKKLRELEENLDHLKKKLPRSGLSRPAFCLFLFLSVIIIGMLAAYFWLTFNGIWLEAPFWEKFLF